MGRVEIPAIWSHLVCGHLLLQPPEANIPSLILLEGSSQGPCTSSLDFIHSGRAYLSASYCFTKTGSRRGESLSHQRAHHRAWDIAVFVVHRNVHPGLSNFLRVLIWTTQEKKQSDDICMWYYPDYGYTRKQIVENENFLYDWLRGGLSKLYEERYCVVERAPDWDLGWDLRQGPADSQLWYLGETTLWGSGTANAAPRIGVLWNFYGAGRLWEKALEAASLEECDLGWPLSRGSCGVMVIVTEMQDLDP